MNTAQADPLAPDPRPANPDTLNVTRQTVKDLLLKSDAFRALPPGQQQEIAKHTVQVASYLVEPEGIRADRLPTGKPRTSGDDEYAMGLAGPAIQEGDNQPGPFTAGAAREGAAVAGALLDAVNFPEFVSGLIQGVFHSIVQSSIEQMEAYGKLVADVAKTLNQFRDENVSANQGRDHLVDTYPDIFEVDTGEDFFGEDRGPRVRMQQGVDESEALRRVSDLPVEGEPLSSLDEETIEQRLVPAARTQLATSRQQLLATMVLMGINRIIVTDGRISAKVLYDFQARDNLRWQESATRFDYDRTLRNITREGEFERRKVGADRSTRYSDGKLQEDTDRDASFYAKGKYKYTNKPVLRAVRAYQEMGDAALQTRASLAGEVRVNFKSETFPLERMADSFQIGRIQDAAQPGSGAPARGARTTTGNGAPAESNTASPATG